MQCFNSVRVISSCFARRGLGNGLGQDQRNIFVCKNKDITNMRKKQKLVIGRDEGVSKFLQFLRTPVV